MIIFMIILIVFQYVTNAAEQSLQCGDWDTFKDEKCFKVIGNKELQKYDDARNTCYQNEGSSLVSIRSQEEQQFLFNLLHIIHKNDNGVWIGAQYKEKTLKWSDNLTANYTNWANGNPRNVSGYECVQMSMIEPNNGQWMNEPCDINYLVVCEKPQNWLFSYLQKTVMEMRENFEKKITKLENELNETKTQLRNTNTELQNTKEEFNRKLTETTPPGTVAHFSATTEPNGWLKANGQSVSRITYAKLFATISTIFGAGDGNTHYPIFAANLFADGVTVVQVLRKTVSLDLFNGERVFHWPHKSMITGESRPQLVSKVDGLLPVKRLTMALKAEENQELRVMDCTLQRKTTRFKMKCITSVASLQVTSRVGV